jgi:ketosteroid isomerase-like protein
MRFLVLLSVFFVTVTSYAQTDQQQIDEQVWKPFTKAIMTQDVAGFVSLHSKDLVRAEINQKKVMNRDEYQKGMETNWPAWKQSMEKNKTKYSFELRFTERLSNGNTAYEVGYFKNEMTNADGTVRKSYGKFHVVLRKEDGTWKVLVDSDSNEGGTITDEIFDKAQPIK